MIDEGITHIQCEYHDCLASATESIWQPQPDGTRLVLGWYCEAHFVPAQTARVRAGAAERRAQEEAARDKIAAQLQALRDLGAHP